MAAAVSAFVIAGSKRKKRSGSTQGGDTSQEIRPSTLTNDAALYALQLIQEGMITPSELVNSQTFYSPTIKLNNALVAPTLTNSQTFYGPSLNRYVLTSLLAATPTIYNASIITTGQIATQLLTITQTFYGPSVGLQILPGLKSETQTFYPAQVIPSNGIGAGLLTNTQTFYRPQLNRFITPSLYTNLAVLRPPSVNPVSGGYQLSPPTYSPTNAAGDPPQGDISFGADIYAGYFLRIQRSLAGAKNNDGSYSSPTLNIRHQITPSEVAALAITNADLGTDGYISPTGSGFQQMRYEREDGAISAWVEFTYNVTASVAEWYATNVAPGTKSQYIDVSNANKTATMNADINGSRLVRATVPGVGSKGFTVTIAGLYSGQSTVNGSIAVGITDAASNLNASTGYPNPGQTAPGLFFMVKKGSTATIFRRNGTQVGGTSLTGNPAVGDQIRLAFSTTANTVSVYYKPVSTGVEAQVASATLTSQIPTDWYAFAGGYMTGDSATADFTNYA